ncbi:hypothetical protein HK099_003546 [Clydaea vesicula]|uniref:PH domain-containing protein n=1 Tax=Clydaea vesicula TaxID=447962 RepID=A0AAD5U640_9FUNG|nr:hypothetical protein HK099_003546 [Clydaea vesicula]KAJ3386577.1 hypothetical protein HDU92_002389 [Lobulomyces angularis]
MIQKTLLGTLDELIADIDNFLIHNENPLPALPNSHLLQNNSKHLSIAPSITSSKSSNAFTSTMNNSSTLDGTLRYVSSLSDSFGGWVYKRSQKKKYIILANHTLYIYNSDAFPSATYEDYLPITSVATCQMSKKKLNCLEFKTQFTTKLNKLDDGVAEEELNYLVNKKLEFQFSKTEEMQVWLSCFNEAINEVKNEKNMNPDSIPYSPTSITDSSTLRYNNSSPPTSPRSTLLSPNLSFDDRSSYSDSIIPLSRSKSWGGYRTSRKLSATQTERDILHLYT